MSAVCEVNINFFGGLLELPTVDIFLDKLPLSEYLVLASVVPRNIHGRRNG